MEEIKNQSWIRKHPILTGVIVFFILMFFIGLISDGSTTQEQTKTSKVGDSLTGNVIAQEPESPQEEVEVEEEEECDWGYVNDYKCDGEKILKKWVRSDCSFEWFYDSTCSYKCKDGECVDEPIQEEANTPPQTTSTIKVTRVIDGDTIEINTGERVRLICIDTPETYEDYYQEAKDYLTDLILNEEIELVKDKSETDRYNRLLRYIYLDGDFVNEMIVENGWAVAYPYNPDTTLCPQIEAAEESAKSKGIGIWAEQEEEDDDEPSSSSGYICSYNAYNCGDFSTHDEAQAVFEACGSGDVHKLDRDNDGKACETLS